MNTEIMDNTAEKEPFVVMAKPVGSVCNLRCEYCYYLGTDDAVGTAPAARMSDETLEKFIRSYIEECGGDTVRFTWHGGEPTLAGLDFYKKAVSLQKKYLPEGKECWNNLQTNGMLLDDEWCSFLAEEKFDVGLSIDGARWVHDRYRRDAAGDATYERVYDTAKRLMAHGVKPDLLCTVTSDSAEDPLSVYRALKNLDTGWMQFIPIVRHMPDGTVTPDSVTPEQYGKFLSEIFDEWILNDVGRTGVQLFAETAMCLNGGSPSLCWMAPTCGRVLIVERDGSVYSCDHFVDTEHKMGTLEDGLRSLADSGRQRKFGEDKRDTLTKQCRECRYLSMCGGGCMKDRFALSDSGEIGQYYLCDGLRSFFAHAEEKLAKLVIMSRQGMKPAAIMEKLREEEREKWKGIGRNDPCPCGSGKKAKNCCWNRKP